ncbi:MAG TPA: hypothetical protein VHM00_02155 [Caldimonas sp.]|jgi:hypothetical protein|nr:hypothetical protein [Caldimonas sp.]HEX2539864.1 hypothetical protein [Caldimonas sp.]
MRAAFRGLSFLAVAVLVAGCGERVQTMPVGAEKKADARSYEITDNGYIAPGWTPGNEGSWDAQLKKRAQAQNDFAPR